MTQADYRQRQDAQLAKQAKAQIEYCEKLWLGLSNQEINELTKDLNMARPKAKATQALKLMEAISFVEAATEDRGQPMFEFVNLQNKQAVCFDGVLAAGMEIEEELTLAPKLDTLKKALAKSGKSLTMTELPSGQLSVKGEKITVKIPCVQPDTLPPISPDPMIAPINDEIKEAFKTLENVIAETGERVFETALLLEGNFATATNGKVLMQYWHGIDLPPNMILPRAFVKAVSKQFKPLVGFGYTPDTSVTFWFEDGSWYKTQVYQDKFPDCNTLLNKESSPGAVPTDLWEGCAQIAEFHELEYIKFKSNEIAAENATYSVNGIQEGKMFDYKLLKKIVPFIDTIDLTTYPDRAFFYGKEGKMRGIIVGIREGNGE